FARLLPFTHMLCLSREYPRLHFDVDFGGFDPPNVGGNRICGVGSIGSEMGEVNCSASPPVVNLSASPMATPYPLATPIRYAYSTPGCRPLSVSDSGT